MTKPQDVFNAYLGRLELVSGGDVTAKWTADGSALLLLDGSPDRLSLNGIDIATGETKPYLDTERVREVLQNATGTKPPFFGIPFDNFSLTGSGEILFGCMSSRWQIDPKTYDLRRLGDLDSFSGALGWRPEDELTPRIWSRRGYLSTTMDVPELLSPSLEWFASIRNNNLIIRPVNARAGREMQLTDDGTPDCSWDLESMRFQLHSGRRVSFRGVNPWSPDSFTLCAYRCDISHVFRLPRVDWLKPFEDVEYLPYQKVGAGLDIVRPVFVEIRGGRQTEVQLGDTTDRYVQFLAWHPGGSEAFFALYTRDFKRVDIVLADRDTGSCQTLLTETSPTFVKNQHEAMFYGEHGFRVLPDGGGFLWLSTRDGWNHIYHYGMDGKLIGRLTGGDWPVQDILRVDPSGDIFFSASCDTARPYDVHICHTSLSGRETKQLTREEGIHSAEFSPRGDAFIDRHSSVSRPWRVDLVSTSGEKIRLLGEMDISRLVEVGYVAPEQFREKAADGVTDIWGVIYKPHDFDPSRSYPVIEYIYGGPQTVETPHFFAIDRSMMSTMYLPWALAQLGYIVVCCDARGTPGRSKEFHDAIYGNFTVGIADHAAVMHALCEANPWMDATRVGITGHSWGGYFSTAALMLASDTYHAAVSYAPSYDPWDAVYYEPYLGPLHNNRAAYEAADIVKYAGKVRGKLMIAAGTSDYFCIYSAMKMTWALIDAGIDHELVVVPQAYHQFVGAEDKYLMMKLTGWFDRHVKNRSEQ